jgi:hypothetical protein
MATAQHDAALAAIMYAARDGQIISPFEALLALAMSFLVPRWR